MKSFDLSNNENIDKEESKRERKHNAVKLPMGLEQNMIPKYVNYYKEYYDQKRKSYREYFKIEKHPHNLNNKLYVTSKSNKKNIMEKLDEIKKMLDIIEFEYQEKQKLESEKNDEQDKNNEIKINEQKEKDENGDSNNLITLPKYVNIKKHEKDNTKYYLIYDKKLGDKRNTLKALCSKNITLKKNLQMFIEKVEEKFKS
jgi:hypothetical protein